MKTWVLVFAALLSGCVTTSKIVPAGQDTYMISAANDTCGNCTPPQIRVTEQASAYCSRMSKTMVVKETQEQTFDIGFGKRVVLGTLEKGYEFIMSAATPADRAALAMFAVAEVHPFTDGNGRTARLAMNLFLTEAGLTRIIIPTVYRNDYISALKAMSANSLPNPLVRMLAGAARFSRWVNMTSKATAFADLRRSNALGRPETDKLMFDDVLTSTALGQ